MAEEEAWCSFLSQFPLSFNWNERSWWQCWDSFFLDRATPQFFTGFWIFMTSMWFPLPWDIEQNRTPLKPGQKVSQNYGKLFNAASRWWAGISRIFLLEGPQSVPEVYHQPSFFWCGSDFFFYRSSGTFFAAWSLNFRASCSRLSSLLV